MRFGDAAIDLQLLDPEDLAQVFGPRSMTADFFHLEPEYFPVATKDVFKVDELLKWGILPLGTKSAGAL